MDVHVLGAGLLVGSVHVVLRRVVKNDVLSATLSGMIAYELAVMFKPPKKRYPRNLSALALSLYKSE